MNVTESNTANLKQRPSTIKPFYQSMIFRFFALILLLVLALFPISLLHDLVDDQIKQESEILNELTSKWGNNQTIVGPILSIPYVERISRIETQTDSKGVKSSVSKDIFNNKTLMLLPENLFIHADLKEVLLSQDHHQTNVFQGQLELSGNFNLEELPDASGYNTIEWDKAFVAIGLHNNKSVEATSPFRWEGSSAIYKPGTQLPKLLGKGIHANLEEVANENALPKFKIRLNLKGIDSFQFAPLGQLTNASISSDWQKTKVTGDVSASSKVSSSDSFEATWRVSNLSRDYPQHWLLEEGKKEVIHYDFKSLLTGVELQANKAENSQNLIKIKTIIHYLLLTLGIIFLSVFILEFKRHSRSKPKFIHYLIVSFPVLLSPILLLALNTMMSFSQAYQVVAATSTALLVLFVIAISKSLMKGFYLLLIIASLFAAQFINLEMPEFTLLAVGAAGLWITIILMMASFNIKENK